MSMKPLSKALRNMEDALRKHSPEILTGIGIAGMITTTVLAVRATPKALVCIDEKREELQTETTAERVDSRHMEVLYSCNSDWYGICTLPYRSKFCKCPKKSGVGNSI